jgi:hypothetical protein
MLLLNHRQTRYGWGLNVSAEGFQYHSSGKTYTDALKELIRKVQVDCGILGCLQEDLCNALREEYNGETESKN